MNFKQRIYALQTRVESETSEWAFSPGSTMELRLKAFRRRGPKWGNGTPTLLSRLVIPTETKGLKFKTRTPAIIGTTI
jgi:hypothetical protein